MSSLMEVEQLLNAAEWDAPFFKKLARNDTAKAPGHQGGVALPRDLREFLPALKNSRVSSSNPTVDRRLKIEVYVDGVARGDDTVRYQIQTWGGTRSPESRITGGMRAIRDHAEEGDFLLMQRRMDSLDVYRLCLVTQGSEIMKGIEALAGGRNWGALKATSMPVRQEDMEAEQAILESALNREFTLFSAPKRTETRQSMLARSAVFSERVRQSYDFRCAVSGIRVRTPSGLSEVEAAHIVPLRESGTNDYRNGICLAQTLHWAFDHGLFGISEDRTVYIPKLACKLNDGEFLTQFHGNRIAEPEDSSFQVHEDALRWHLENRVKQWEE